MHHHYNIYDTGTGTLLYSQLSNIVTHELLLSHCCSFYQGLRYPFRLLQDVDEMREPAYSAALHSLMLAKWAKSRHRLALKAQLAPQQLTFDLFLKFFHSTMMLPKLEFTPPVVTVETYGSRNNDPQPFSNVVSGQTLDLLYPARCRDLTDTF